MAMRINATPLSFWIGFRTLVANDDLFQLNSGLASEKHAWEECIPAVITIFSASRGMPL